MIPAVAPAATETAIATEPVSDVDPLFESVSRAIENWRIDWESRDADAYLSNYHPAFSNAKHDYNSWAKYKRQINRNKTFINVDVSNIKIVKEIADGPEGQTVVVIFHQKYRSNNFSANDRKQLYLTRNSQEASWKIRSEGSVGSAPRKSIVRQLAINSSVTESSTNNSSEMKWAINIAAFDTKSRAVEMAASILIDGEQQPFVSDVPLNSRDSHRVRIGMYASKSAAVDAMMQICPQLDVSDCWLENLPDDRR